MEAHVNKVRRDSNFEWEPALGVLHGRFRNGMTKDIKYQESGPVRTSTICRWERLLRSLEDLLEGALVRMLALVWISVPLGLSRSTFKGFNLHVGWTNQRSDMFRPSCGLSYH